MNKEALQLAAPWMESKDVMLVEISKKNRRSTLSYLIQLQSVKKQQVSDNHLRGDQ